VDTLQTNRLAGSLVWDYSTRRQQIKKIVKRLHYICTLNLILTLSDIYNVQIVECT